MRTKRGCRTAIENGVIITLLVLSVCIFVLSFFPYSRISAFFLQELEMKRITERICSLVFMFTFWHLMQRQRAAWAVSVLLLAVGIAQHIIFLNSVIRTAFARNPLPSSSALSLIFILAEALILLFLLLYSRDFCCRSAHETRRRSLVFFLAATAAILLNSAVSYHLLKTSLPQRPGYLFLHSMNETLGILFGTIDFHTQGLPGARFENYMFWFTWVCLFFALFYALRPFIEKYLLTDDRRQRARDLVLKYGQNPASYLTLEDDKYLYFSHCAEGVVAYGVVGSTVLVNGDPVCAPENFAAVLAEFQDFCVRSSHAIVFLSITPCYKDLYEKAGFGIVKCGEEARFDLDSYDIAGKKGAKMRMNINHAVKSGLTVHEYRPSGQREPETEKAFERITEEWLSDKKSSMLSFTMGTMGLDDPMDRRYFYAAGPDGTILGFHVFCPFAEGKGYMADITRRTHNAPGGITELINYEAFRVFKSEGFRCASLGVAPLANLCSGDETPGSMEKFLNYVYEHLNSSYGFKDLYRTKASYSPSEWVPAYYCFLPSVPVPSMMYAIIRVQNRAGIMDYVKPAVIRSLESARKHPDQHP